MNLKVIINHKTIFKVRLLLATSIFKHVSLTKFVKIVEQSVKVIIIVAIVQNTDPNTQFITFVLKEISSLK